MKYSVRRSKYFLLPAGTLLTSAHSDVPTSRCARPFDFATSEMISGARRRNPAGHPGNHGVPLCEGSRRLPCRRTLPRSVTVPLAPLSRSAAVLRAVSNPDHPAETASACRRDAGCRILEYNDVQWRSAETARGFQKHVGIRFAAQTEAIGVGTVNPYIEGRRQAASAQNFRAVMAGFCCLAGKKLVKQLLPCTGMDRYSLRNYALEVEHEGLELLDIDGDHSRRYRSSSRSKRKTITGQVE